MNSNDFDRGTFFARYTYSGEATTVIDFRAFVESLLDSGGSIAGFNLRFAHPTAFPSNAPFVSYHSLETPDLLGVDANPPLIVCTGFPCDPVFDDGFESGDVTAWTGP